MPYKGQGDNHRSVQILSSSALQDSQEIVLITGSKLTQC